MYKTLLKIVLVLALTSCSSLKGKAPKDYVFKSKSAKKSYIDAYNKSMQLWDVPYKEEDIRTSLGKAHVIITGPSNGAPVVLLHGMDATSTMWFPNIRALSASYRVYSIDFLNEAGKSQSIEKSLSKEEIVDWYGEIFNHYKLRDFTLIGASKGGWLATLLAVQKESRAAKLILLSPAQTFQGIDKAGKASKALLLKVFPSRKKLKKTLEAFSSHPERIPSVYKNQFYLANKHTKSSSSFLQMQPFSDNELKQINVPVLVVIGDRDIVNSEETLSRAGKTLSKSKIVTLKDAGHFLSIDQSEKVNKLMIDFMK